MNELGIADFIFTSLHPHFMAAITLLLAIIYLFKYLCQYDECRQGQNPMHLLRAFLAFLFAVAWVFFPYLDLTIGRSVLRAMMAIIVLVEIFYNVLYINDALKETWRWIFRR